MTIAIRVRSLPRLPRRAVRVLKNTVKPVEAVKASREGLGFFASFERMLASQADLMVGRMGE